MSHEHTERKETQKYLRKSCYHRIKYIVATFLAAFMWRRPLNNATLATTTHRKPKRVSDGTGTQIRAQMINKCRIKMIQMELYNVRDPPWEEDRKNREREHCNNLNCLCTQVWSIYTGVTSSDWKSIDIRPLICVWLSFNSELAIVQLIRCDLPGLKIHWYKISYLCLTII